ncbi:MAG: dTDP-4-dehydrorhamnose reductase [Maricaulis sp.]|jgi:dTDP-4-dehydrorhamnose reductase
MAGDIILIGRSGQVAAAVAALAAGQGRNLRQFARPELDLAGPDTIDTALVPVLMSAAAGSVLVNAAAYTDVNRAESEPDLAHAINAAAPGILADRCRQAGIALIHLSTDYVFDGLKSAPYRESDPCNPVSVYGHSKLAGDEAIMASGARHVILRTSAVYSPSGQNFLRTMLRLGASQDRVRVVSDQITCPTAAADIAAAILSIADQLTDGADTRGVFHYCGDTPRSWADFAADIFAAAWPGAGRKPAVERIGTVDYPTPAQRPPYSVLDCDAISQAFGIARPNHERALALTLARLPAGS